MVTNRISNRGHLKRLISKGLIEVKCKYHYTDDYAYDSAYNFGKTDWMPAVLNNDNKFDENSISFNDWDFTSCGYLSKIKEDGTYSFAIHSNLVYSVRFKEVINSVPVTEFNNEIFAGGNIIDFKHTQTGEDLKVLKLNKRLTKEEFKNFNEWLQSEDKGYYSKFAKGFILKIKNTNNNETNVLSIITINNGIIEDLMISNSPKVAEGLAFNKSKLLHPTENFSNWDDAIKFYSSNQTSYKVAISNRHVKIGDTYAS